MREEAAFIEDDAEGAGYDAAEAYSSRRVADDGEGLRSICAVTGSALSLSRGALPVPQIACRIGT